VIVPKAHRPTVFDLTREEVAATFDLLRDARPLFEARYRPDGYTIGWNCSRRRARRCRTRTSTCSLATPTSRMPGEACAGG
jgi:hypothetical protein